MGSQRIQRIEKRRHIRLKRLMMAVYSYVLLWLGVAAGTGVGLFDLHTPHVQIFMITLGINLVLFILITSGALDKIKEAPLTIFQITVGLLVITAVIHYGVALEGGLLVLYFLTIMFGLFALSRKHLVLVSLILLGMYTAHELWHWYTEPFNRLLSISMGHWFILVLGLTWFIYVGGYIYELQRSHRIQQQQLKAQQITLKEQNHQLSEVAVRDSLTQLHNRRYLLTYLAQELLRHHRLELPLQVVLIDLDHFKQVNDTHGHHMGDEVLTTFAYYLRNYLRTDDLLVRYGGEEFVVVFSNTEKAKALKALKRLQQAFAEHEFTGKPPFSTSFSAGIAQNRQNENVDQILKRADAALYEAKALGRNRICIAE